MSTTTVLALPAHWRRHADNAACPAVADTLRLCALQLEIRMGDIGEEQETIESEPIEVPIETPVPEKVPA